MGLIKCNRAVVAQNKIWIILCNGNVVKLKNFILFSKGTLSSLDSSIHPYTPVVKRHTQSERERERLNQTLSGHPILGPSNPPATTPTTQGRYTQLTQNTPSSSNTTAGFGSASAFFRLATELKSAKDELECEKNEVQRLGKELKRKNELIALAKNGGMT